MRGRIIGGLIGLAIGGADLVWSVWSVWFGQSRGILGRVSGGGDLASLGGLVGGVGLVWGSGVEGVNLTG